MEDPISPDAIGKRLRAVRMAIGTTQEQFAAGIGATQGGFGQYEAGMRRPSVIIASALCTVYGLTLDFIYRGDRRGLSPAMLKSLAELLPESVGAAESEE